MAGSDQSYSDSRFWIGLVASRSPQMLMSSGYWVSPTGAEWSHSRSRGIRVNELVAFFCSHPLLVSHRARSTRHELTISLHTCSQSTDVLKGRLVDSCRPRFPTTPRKTDSATHRLPGRRRYVRHFFLQNLFV
ncbi:hypothetical protein CVT26_007747 [Gymnopilus dilepis]|uniref:Uncharacterized protein n=1 Tax=Gymnopilus dilepis TaxID=231916 RepID=A0A409X637_9AGAR|nr:hypothetical protein CVT26_007747 [Gymnopilus dilepis]